MRLLILLLAILFASCGKADQKSAPTQDKPERYEELMSKRAVYFMLAQTHQDDNGWFINDCDALLWNSLGSVAGLPITIEAARHENGYFRRRPAQDCYETGKSASDISKDMLLGLAWHAFYSFSPDLFESVLRSGRSSGYIMGRGPISRTFMTPSLQAVYAEALVALDGKGFQPELSYPQLYVAGNRGYQAHLQVLNILLRYRTTGGISNEALERLQDHRNRNPRNCFFQYAYHAFYTGNMVEPVECLLDDPAFPDARLPTSADRCEAWIFQREVEKWRKCPEEAKQHHGVDLLFVSKLIAEFYGER